jgi:hypothetical protein
MEQNSDSPAARTANTTADTTATAACRQADLNPLTEASGLPVAAASPGAPAADAPDADPDEAEPSRLDAHGFDPAEYEWVPVLRKPRADGWSPQRQVDFIAALADTGVVSEAARRVKMTVQSCYRLRRSPGAEGFSAAWDAALHQASKRLADLAFERAIAGVDEPVLDKEGRCIYVRTRYNDRLLMFLLRAHQPERYRHAQQSVRQPAEPPPPDMTPVAEAIRTLEPAPPAEPHRLMPPGELEIAIECADMLDGKLARWHRYPGQEPEPPPVDAPLGEEFERRLEAAKRPFSPVHPLESDDERPESGFFRSDF